MADVTQILSQIESGDPSAVEELLPLVYEELRKLARAKMASERPDHTLSATALVHEAYLRLVGPTATQEWHSRGHFFGAAAEAMRRILIDRARRRNRQKRGGNRIRQDLNDVEMSLGMSQVDLLALDEALTKLEQNAPQKAELVKLRFFAGLTIPEAAEALGISSSTADNYWAYARCWLRLEMTGDTGEP